MNRIKEHLDQFTDYELVVFVKHHFYEYMQNTQEKIKYYVKYKRGIDPYQAKKLFANKPKINPNTRYLHCPQCHSTKLSISKVKWEIPAFQIGYEDEMAMWKELTTGEVTYKDKIACLVCGYVVYDPNNVKRKWWQKILDFFFDQPLPV